MQFVLHINLTFYHLAVFEDFDFPKLAQFWKIEKPVLQNLQNHV